MLLHCLVVFESHRYYLTYGQDWRLEILAGFAEGNYPPRDPRPIQVSSQGSHRQEKWKVRLAQSLLLGLHSPGVRLETSKLNP